MDLTNASALVTGGAGGFGGATARRLAEKGARVVIADVADERGEALAKELGNGSVYVRTDIMDEASIANAVAAAVDLGPLRAFAMEADAILVEPWAAHATGGTGIALDHALAREARARLADATMVLAGGLTPETVAAAVALVRPDIVDVSSGVERLPGIKDPHKIARFMEAVVGHSAIS